MPAATERKQEPVEQSKPVEQPRVTEKPTPVDQPKAVEQPKPIQPSIPVEEPKPAEQEQAIPVEHSRPTEQPKPAESSQSIQQPLPVHFVDVGAVQQKTQETSEIAGPSSAPLLRHETEMNTDVDANVGADDDIVPPSADNIEDDDTPLLAHEITPSASKVQTEEAEDSMDDEPSHYDEEKPNTDAELDEDDGVPLMRHETSPRAPAVEQFEQNSPLLRHETSPQNFATTADDNIAPLLRHESMSPEDDRSRSTRQTSAASSRSQDQNDDVVLEKLPTDHAAILQHLRRASLRHDDEEATDIPSSSLHRSISNASQGSANPLGAINETEEEMDTPKVEELDDHHVQETIQPVVQKQTVEPHVTHTVVPIHEVHHNAASHHATSAFPAVSMAEFKKAGGVLTGGEERYNKFEGEPKSMMGEVMNDSAPVLAEAVAERDGKLDQLISDRFEDQTAPTYHVQKHSHKHQQSHTGPIELLTPPMTPDMRESDLVEEERFQPFPSAASEPTKHIQSADEQQDEIVKKDTPKFESMEIDEQSNKARSIFATIKELFLGLGTWFAGLLGGTGRAT